MSEEDNAGQAKALVEALTPELLKSVMPEIAKAVEDQIKPLAEKNKEILGKLAQTKDQNADLAKHVSDLEAANKAQPFDPERQADPIIITREQARSVSTYRAAKLEAAKRGVPLQFAD